MDARWAKFNTDGGDTLSREEMTSKLAKMKAKMTQPDALVLGEDDDFVPEGFYWRKLFDPNYSA